MKNFATLLLLFGYALRAQTPAVFATGLSNPSKLILTPAGNLLVTEAGTGRNTGRISIVDKSGIRGTLVDGLPSGLAAPGLDPDGPNGLVVQGNSIYILNGEGDGFRNGTAPNTVVPNPGGPASPLFSSVIKLTLPASIDALTGSFSVTAADQSALADGNTATLTNANGASAMLEIVTDFRDGIADPVTVWRNSHPYGMAALDSRPDKLYVADAGMNLLYEVTLSTGRSRVLTRFAPIPNPPGTAGPPVSEAVPTSVRAYGDHLLVTLLHGFPFPPGGAQVYEVDPASGLATPFIANLSSAIDVASDTRASGRPLFFTLEFSANQGSPTPVPGRLTRYDTAQGKIVADGLIAPTNIAYDSVSQTVYVLQGNGTILKVSGQ